MQNLQENETAAKVILQTCAGLKKGERILIAFDSLDDTRVQRLVSMANQLGALVTSLRIDGSVTREPPMEVASRMLENDVTLFCVNEQRTLLWGHADAKVAALKKLARVLFLTQKIEDTPTPPELQEIRNRSHKLGDILERTSNIKIVTGGNSTMEIKLVGRKSLRLSSLLSSPGSWGAIPDYAEAAVAPLETGSNGTILINGLIVGIGKVDSPVCLQFENGRLTRISGGKAASEFEELLSQYDNSARVLCELGFGTNNLRSDVRGEFDDKKALGSVHIALGDNHTFGGENKSSLHIDCLMVNPHVYFDGKPVDLMAI